MTVPDEVGVYGGGRMGAGIAHSFLLVGSRVTVIESNDGAAQEARERIESSLNKAVERGVLADGGAAAERLHVTVDPVELAACELIIEAVPEDIELKKQILAIIEHAAPRARGHADA